MVCVQSNPYVESFGYFLFRYVEGLYPFLSDVNAFDILVPLHGQIMAVHVPPGLSIFDSSVCGA